MAELIPKTVSESKISSYPYEVFPNDLNPHNTVFGGRVLEVADRLVGVVAQRHSNRTCVTLLVDSVRFLKPARRGDILIFQASVNRVWHTSLEVGVKVMAESFLNGTTKHIVSAYFTFVAVDENHHVVEICPLIPETDDEKRRFEKAQIRRDMRLQMLG